MRATHAKPRQRGTPRLTEAIRRQFLRDHGLDDPLDEMLVANGGEVIIANACLAAIDRGGEIVFPAPDSIAYADHARFAGSVPRFITCPNDHVFKPLAEDLVAAIIAHTEWVVLNSPNHPSGAVSRSTSTAPRRCSRRPMPRWCIGRLMA